MAKTKIFELYIIRVNGIVQCKTWSKRKKESVERSLRNGGAWYITETIEVPQKKKVSEKQYPVQLALF